MTGFPLRTALIVAPLLASILSAAPARAEVIERVVAVVNDEALFLSELRRRSAPYLGRVMSAPSEAERIAGLNQLYQELLQRMIDEVLIEQTARRMSVRVTSSQVDQSIANVIRQNGLTEDQFWEAVRGQGFTESQYRSDVRRQILRLKVMNTRVRGRVNITEADVRERYEERVRAANRQTRMRVAHIFLALPDGATASDVAAAEQEAANVRGRATLDNFFQIAGEYDGGELGWLGEGELPAEFERALLTLEQGEISAPVRGPNGYHIFLLQEREQGGADLPAFEQVREQLQNQMMERAMMRQEEAFLQELRQDAIVVERL